MAPGANTPSKQSMPVQDWLKFQFTEITTAADILKDTCMSVQKRKFDLVLPDLGEETPFSGKYTSSIVRDCHNVIIEHINTLLNIESELRKEMATRFPAEAKRVKYSTLNIPAYCKVHIQTQSETESSSPEKGHSSSRKLFGHSSLGLGDGDSVLDVANRTLTHDPVANSGEELFSPGKMSTPMRSNSKTDKGVTSVKNPVEKSSEVEVPVATSEAVENIEAPDTNEENNVPGASDIQTGSIDNEPLASSTLRNELIVQRGEAAVEVEPEMPAKRKPGRPRKRTDNSCGDRTSSDERPKRKGIKRGKYPRIKKNGNGEDAKLNKDGVEDADGDKDVEQINVVAESIVDNNVDKDKNVEAHSDDDDNDANVTVPIPKFKKGSKKADKEDSAFKKSVLEDVATDGSTAGSSAEDDASALKIKDPKAGSSKNINPSGKSLLTSTATQEQTDPKLALQAKLVLDKLDSIIFKEVKKSGVIRLGIGKYTQEQDELSECIKKIFNYNPVISTEVSIGKKGKSKPGPKSRKKVVEKENESIGMDEEEIVEETPTLDKVKRKNDVVIKSDKISVDNGKDVVGDNLDSEKELSSEDNKVEKRTVLGDSDASNSKPEPNKSKEKGGKSYKTPGAKLQDDDESDDSDIPINKKIKKAKQKAENDESSSDFDVRPKKKFLKASKAKGSESSASVHSESKSSEDSRSARLKKRNTRTSKRNKSPVSDSEDESKKKPKKKMRRRIQSSSSSSSNDEGDTTKKSPEKGRKNIRKVIKGKNLEKSTRQAGLDEEERKKRVIEKQKLFNEHFKAPDASEMELTQVVLDFDAETKEPLLSLDTEIVKKLKPHQAEGIRFMWNACFESISKKGKGDGCILAHCMGLGKTLQTIGFLHTILANEKLLGLKTALVICPLSTVGNWYNEFRMWLKDVDSRVNLHRLWENKPHQRMSALEEWKEMGGVGIIHYDAFRLLVSAEDKKGKKKPKPKELKIIRETLIDPGADIVVCDEGHLLKNPQSQQSKAVNKVATRRRIVLTGTPLQNNLLEYHTMMQFVKPSLLGSRKEFSNRFVNPILNGQHKDSDDHDVKIMKRRAHVLHKLLDGCVQRLDYSVLTPFLPPKYEYALSINLTDIQKQLYKHYIDNLIGNRKGDKFVTSKLFADYQILVKIWTHPKVLTYRSRAQERKDSSDSEEGSIKDFIVDKSTTEEELTSDDDARSDRSERSGSASDWSQERRKRKKKTKKAVIIDDDDDVEEVAKVEVIGEANAEKLEDDTPAGIPSKWYQPFFDTLEDYNAMEHSGKLLVLMEILKTCESIGDRVLVFSQFLTSLDLIEDILAEIDEKSKESTLDDSATVDDDQPLIGRWRHGIEYFRIDGSTKTDERQKSCDTFNQESASKAKLFLISTRAGGLGINLVGANRVVIFDASWNPSQDLQSIFRVFRFGQTKPCYIYRLLARGTMEEKIYNRQVVKLSLSCRVVDEQQIERHFHFDEIRQMYQFDAEDKTERPTPIVPKDRLLADLLISHKDLVFSYLEHDSLLENKHEEELTEAERKAAWEEYNNINEPKQNLLHRGSGDLRQDQWIVQTAQHFAKLQPGKPELQYLMDAQRAKMEVHAMVTHWDYIHSDTVNEFFKMKYREKFDTLFDLLSRKFGPTANWDPVLRSYPHQNMYPDNYIYSRPNTNTISARRLKAALAGQQQQRPQLVQQSINNIGEVAQAIMRGMGPDSKGMTINPSHAIPGTSRRTYPGVNIVPSKTIFEETPTSSNRRSTKTRPSIFVPPNQPAGPSEPPPEVILLDN